MSLAVNLSRTVAHARSLNRTLVRTGRAFTVSTMRQTQFVVLAYDGKDRGALDRRLSVRGAHLEGVKTLKQNGHMISGGALFDDDGEKMIGSLMIVEFPNREYLQKEWLDHDPYITGNVWKDVTITEFKPAPI
eukprot:CFRG0153T1